MGVCAKFLLIRMEKEWKYITSKAQVCAVCVCVCERERERERKGMRERERERKKESSTKGN
jgi:hypothetical protein